MRPASLVLACLLFAGPALAAQPAEPGRRVTPETQAALARIEARMAETRTIHARFRQRKLVPLFAKEIELRGEIGLEKPDRFLWRVESPVPYCLSLDKTGFRQWDAETKRVQKGRLDGNPVLRVVVDQLTGFFSGRFLKMTEDFEITLSRSQPLELTGTARPGSPAASSLRSFTVRFAPEERHVSAVTVMENGGGETRLEFYDAQLNTTLAPEFWEVVPRGR